MQGREGSLSELVAPGLHWHFKGLSFSSTQVPSGPQSMNRQAGPEKYKKKYQASHCDYYI
jgi:hypothetical protein